VLGSRRHLSEFLEFIERFGFLLILVLFLLFGSFLLLLLVFIRFGLVFCYSFIYLFRVFLVVWGAFFWVSEELL
jgi:hypothetical protein